MNYHQNNNILLEYKKNWQKNQSETSENGNDKDRPKERYISLEERQKVLIIYNSLYYYNQIIIV